jgi:hypothetical protein
VALIEKDVLVVGVAEDLRFLGRDRTELGP